MNMVNLEDAAPLNTSTPGVNVLVAAGSKGDSPKGPEAKKTSDSTASDDTPEGADLEKLTQIIRSTQTPTQRKIQAEQEKHQLRQLKTKNRQEIRTLRLEDKKNARIAKRARDSERLRSRIVDLGLVEDRQAEEMSYEQLRSTLAEHVRTTSRSRGRTAANRNIKELANPTRSGTPRQLSQLEYDALTPEQRKAHLRGPGGSIADPNTVNGAAARENMPATRKPTNTQFMTQLTNDIQARKMGFSDSADPQFQELLQLRGSL